MYALRNECFSFPFVLKDRRKIGTEGVLQDFDKNIKPSPLKGLELLFSYYLTRTLAPLKFSDLPTALRWEVSVKQVHDDFSENQRRIFCEYTPYQIDL